MHIRLSRPDQASRPQLSVQHTDSETGQPRDEPVLIHQNTAKSGKRSVGHAYRSLDADWLLATLPLCCCHSCSPTGLPSLPTRPAHETLSAHS